LQFIHFLFSLKFPFFFEEKNPLKFLICGKKKTLQRKKKKYVYEKKRKKVQVCPIRSRSELKPSVYSGIMRGGRPSSHGGIVGTFNDIEVAFISIEVKQISVAAECRIIIFYAHKF